MGYFLGYITVLIQIATQIIVTTLTNKEIGLILGVLVGLSILGYDYIHEKQIKKNTNN